MTRATSTGGHDTLRYKQRPAQGTTLQSLRGDQLASATRSTKWRHPWWTQPAWSAQAGRWVATVLPGLVNGIAPIYRATVAEQQAVGNPWENNPLTGKQFFSASVFSQPTETVGAQIVDLPLYLNPAIPLDFRGIGFDGDPAEALPQFFVNLGAAHAPRQPSALDLAQGTPSADLTPPANLRLVRACDLWVHQPRLGLTSSFAPGGLGGAPFVQQLAVASPAARDALRVFQGTFTPFTASTAGVDPTEADFTEPTFDELLISTVYLVSPPKTPLGSAPDASWAPYVRHNLFWNLHWAQPGFRQPAADIAQIGFPPLAAGAGTLVISLFQSLLADAQQTAANILAGTSLAGTFWTPTARGSSGFSTFNSPPATSSGPDRAKNRAAALAAQQAQQRLVQLDPDFPYNARRFPTAFLSAA